MYKTILLILALFLLAGITLAGLPTTLNDFFFPGSQPNESGNLQTPQKCDNCHGGYDIEVEPAFTWRGSMMAQAARDPLYFASVAIANQDAAESGDLCIRCHSPAGWLEGRSTPTDGSALNNNDREGVQCDFCHKLIMPSNPIANQFPDDIDYTNNTFPQDSDYLSTITSPAMSGNGGYVADASNSKRGPFIDANATHQMFYSPFHTLSDICGTCHDVSNPAYAKDSLGNYIPNELNQPSPSFNTYDMFPVERTFSEWKYSAYNTLEGVYAPQFGGNKDTVRTCQDCHMRDVTGYGCNKSGVLLRDDLPLHDMTGGNTFVPLLIESVYPGEADLDALDSGIVRARYMLQQAASLDVSTAVEGNSHVTIITITNETGHKLPSGYPEGRRIWLNVKAYNSSENIIYESGRYIDSTGELIHDDDIKIYEIKPGMTDDIASLLGYDPGPSFHFVVNNKIFFDNRIPPRGFTNANYEMIQSPPVGYSYPDGQYWDNTEYTLPGAAARIEVVLYYQTTSKEYVEFLRDNNVTNDWGNIMYDLWINNGRSAPEEMDTISIDVTPLAGNQSPVLNPIGDKTVSENAHLSFTVTVSDPDGTTPDLTVSTLPDGATFTDNNDGTGLFHWVPSYEQAGNHDVTFYATDAEAPYPADSATITITVTNLNRDPMIAIEDNGYFNVDEGDGMTFTVYGMDPDGPYPILEVSSDYGLVENMTFVDNLDGTGICTFNPDFTQGDNDTLDHKDYHIQFRAVDAEDSTAITYSDYVQIRVYNVNRPPVIEPVNDTICFVDNTLGIEITAIDPDNESLTFTASNMPEGAVFEDLGWDPGLGKYKALFSWIPDATQVGVHADIEISCSDNDLIEYAYFAITVSEAGFLCGDVNVSGSVNILDITYIIDYIYKGGPSPNPTESGDVNSSLSINILDITYLIAYLYKGGPAPNCP